MKGDIVVFRGGGDIATGSIHRLHRSGFRVLVLEIDKPTAIRRSVAFSEAIYNLSHKVEDVEAIRVSYINEIEKAWSMDLVPVMCDPKCDILNDIKPLVLVDGIIAKKNLGTKKSLAPITIALGPGFLAGSDENADVDVVIETMRGHNLGRLIFDGYASDNTGTPGIIAGIGKERVIYSNADGIIKCINSIGDCVKKGDVIANVGGESVIATIDGLLRGIIRDGSDVFKGMKIADIDPRYDEYDNCFTISDKARAIGGSVLEAVMIMKRIKNL